MIKLIKFILETKKKNLMKRINKKLAYPKKEVLRVKLISINVILNYLKDL